MADIDISEAAEKIKSMFETDEGKEQLGNIISMLGGNADDAQTEKDGIDTSEVDMVLKMKKIMEVMKHNGGGKYGMLLEALSPLVRPERQKKMEKAAKLMGVGAAISVLRNENML